jgi:hypothetical protein
MASNTASMETTYASGGLLVVARCLRGNAAITVVKLAAAASGRHRDGGSVIQQREVSGTRKEDPKGTAASKMPPTSATVCGCSSSN